MNGIIKVEVDGNPIPLQRARATRNRFYDPQFIAKKNFASEVMSQIHIDKPIDTKIAFDIIFVIKIPKSWSKKKKALYIDVPHTQTPDVDNLIKFVFDSLNGKLFVDDAQIFSVEGFKAWGEEGKTIMEIRYDQPKSKN
jgi:Holliday junction resolvase RusA-like endonuclease